MRHRPLNAFRATSAAGFLTVSSTALLTVLASCAACLVAAAEPAARLFPDPPGLCSYTFRTQFAKDVPGTLDAVKALGEGCDLVLVVGSKNSSNSVRLVEVAMRAGAPAAYLVDDASQVDWSWFDGVNTVGVTAGASAPEPLIEALVDAIRGRFDAMVTEDDGARETVTFKLPRLLTA